MRDAIVTQLKPATESHGARMRIVRGNKSEYVPYDYALDLECNHQTACEHYVKRFLVKDWRWVGGSLPNGDYAWVCLD